MSITCEDIRIITTLNTKWDDNCLAVHLKNGKTVLMHADVVMHLLHNHVFDTMKHDGMEYLIQPQEIDLLQSVPSVEEI